MIICNDTIEVLKNYAEINQSLLCKQGSQLKTVNEQTNVLSKCTVNETFPQEFAIYDLNKFLGVLSLFSEPDMNFSDNSVSIKSSIDANNSEEALVAFKNAEKIDTHANKNVIHKNTAARYKSRLVQAIKKIS